MSSQLQAKTTDRIDAAWARLVSRAVRVALTRQDASYAQVAAELTRVGLGESARSVEGKVQRGTFRFTFFLQALYAAGAAYPSSWSVAMSEDTSWESRATAVLKAELALQPWLDWHKLSRRLEEIGARISPETLCAQVEDGTFTAVLFFQCATVCRFEGLQLFLDLSAVNDAARAGAVAS